MYKKTKMSVEEQLRNVYDFIVKMKPANDTKLYDTAYAGSSANDFTNIYDTVFKLSTKEKEREILKTIYDALQEVKRQYLAEIALIESNHKYVIDNPIYSEKNINRKIADYAYQVKAETYKRMLEYLMVVQSTQRISAFIHRFWLPNQSSSNNTIEMNDGKTIYVPKSVVNLGYVIWPEIDYKKIQEYTEQN